MNYLKHKMKTKSPAVIAGWIVLGIIAAVGFAILFGFIIMWLWNWLMPAIFGLGLITYWQAVALFILAKILFGGFGNHSGNKSSNKKNNMKCETKREKTDFSKWELYDKFWQEEGEEAYQAYIKRTNGNNTPE
jgi:hypothetical protein